MKKLAAFLVFLWVGPTFAADIPYKAPTLRVASSPCTLQQCSGFYVGVNIIGAGTNADILGNGINGSVFSGGGAIGLTGGYQLWNGNFFAAAEVFGDYDAGVNPMGASKGRYIFGEMAKFGLGLNNVFSNQPTPSQGPITIPSALAGSLLSPYVQVGAVERPWGTAWATGAGADFTLGGGWNLDLSYIYANYQKTTATTPVIVTIPNENLIKLGLNRKF